MTLQGYKLYGRRKGRKLSDSLKLTYKNYSSKYYINPEKIIKLNNCFSKKNILEIGFGSGENLVNLSKNNPLRFFVGCEPYVNSSVKLLNKVVQEKIKNLLIWPDDVRLIIKDFREQFFDLILLLHPDPWPKKKHAKRRLIQQSFLNDIHKVMKTKGHLIISTDHETMKNWILEQFNIRNDFNWVKKTNKYINKSPKWILDTKYSKKAFESKNITNWFFFKKK